MCLMCIEIMNERMTIDEARKALPELIDTARSNEDLEHYRQMQAANDEKLKAMANEEAQKNT